MDAQMAARFDGQWWAGTLRMQARLPCSLCLFLFMVGKAKFVGEISVQQR